MSLESALLIVIILLCSLHGSVLSVSTSLLCMLESRILQQTWLNKTTFIHWQVSNILDESNRLLIRNDKYFYQYI